MASKSSVFDAPKNKLTDALNSSKNNNSKGTYDSSTGTYTDTSGNKQSVATAPAGSKLIGGGGSSYTGGGNAGKVKLPVVVPKSEQEITNEIKNLEISKNIAEKSNNQKVIDAYNKQVDRINNEINKYNFYSQNIEPQIQKQQLEQLNNPFRKVPLKETLSNGVQIKEINRYKNLGFSDKDSYNLALYSKITGTTPTLKTILENRLAPELMNTGGASPIFRPKELGYKGKEDWASEGLSALDVATLSTLGAGKLLGKGGLKVAAKKIIPTIYSKEATALPNLAYEKSYNPKSQVGMFGKASLSSLMLLRFPSIGIAYGSELIKGAATKPKETYESLKEQAIKKPGELAGFLVGGALLKKGLNLAERKVRGIGGYEVKTEKIKLKDYGEVTLQKIPKYREVVWIEGAFDATEKVNVMKQIDRLKGHKERIFVQVSPSGIPTKVFSSSRNMGFEVKQVSQPLRGLYQAPPWQFLEKYKNILKTNAGSASYYAGNLARERILPNPLEYFRGLISNDTFSTQRPFQYLERTYKGIKTPNWIEEVAKSMNENKPLPSKYTSRINKYYQEFLRKPIEFNGKIYKGLEKERLLNKFNLLSSGSGTKLKVYSALMEYQIKNKVTLVSGAENLSGIKPYGPESQIVRSIGTRFYEKSRSDLRKGLKPSVTRKVTELLTGTKRGQFVAQINGKLVEIQPVRSFPGKIKERIKTAKFKEADITDNLVKRVTRQRTSRTRNPPRSLLIPRTKEAIKSQKRISRREERTSILDNLVPISRISNRESRRREPNRISTRRFNPIRRKNEIPREPPRTPEERRNPERPRPRPPENRIPRVPERPIKEYPPITRLLTNQRERGKLPIKKIIRKKSGYRVLPTVFENLMAGRNLRSRVAKREISGFESFRFI